MNADHSSSALPTDRGGVIGRSMASRGQHLVRADRRFATGSGLRRASSPRRRVTGCSPKSTGRLDHGGITLTAPGGSVHRLGFRRGGSRSNRPARKLACFSSPCDLRLGCGAGTRPGRLANGRARTRSPSSSFSSANAGRAWRCRACQGPVQAGQRAGAPLAGQRAAQGAQGNIAAHYDLGNDFYSAWLDDTMN